MRQVVLGRSSISVSAIGIGGVQFSKISSGAVAKVIHAAIGEGITFFETAYGYFDSEEKMGPALRGKRDGLALASKNTARDGRTFARRLHESLRRLQTDVIDLYQLHGVDDEKSLAQATGPRGAMAAADKARQQGKIRSVGITTHSLKMAMKAVRTGLFDSVQYPISLINTEVPRSGLLKLARQQNVGLIAMKPFGGGRIENARLALGYIYRLRGVVPVVGVETTAQVVELARLARHPPRLTHMDFEAIRQVRSSIGTTFCRACRYCEPCPKGISIFRVLYLPVYLMQMGRKRVLADGLPDWLRQAEKCTACRRCEKRCPFSLHIVDGLKHSLSLARLDP